MKVRGEALLHAPVEKVWGALNDPAVLARTIPGCERLDEIGPDHYRMTVSAGVASIKGTYQGDVQLAEQRPPDAFVLRAIGAGAPGTVSADVAVRLTDAGDGSTRLDYDADAVVGGMIGGVGQRVLSGVAKKTAGEFFRAVDDVLTGTAPVMAAAAAHGGAGGPDAAAAGALIAGQQVPARDASGQPVAGQPSGQPSPAQGVAAVLLAAVAGAAIALSGVVIGWRLGRGPRT
ncbi:MAG: carbon monoxide dehydrogenase subunit G [Actinomycetota bacterium]|nr:carbon monoxide dehydrogenase subunit G [Actinomycetota bacterium]